MGLVGIAGILPYMIDILESGILKEAPAPEFPLAIIILLAFVQNGVLLSIVILFGMLLSERVGLRMPIINAWASRQHPVKMKSVLLPGIYWGAAAGVLVVTIEALFFIKQLPQSMLPFFDIPLWKRLLSGVLYGGFTEELFMRLFLLPLVAGLLGRLWKTPEGLPNSKAFWIAIILVAVIFGLGHLPATSFVTSLTPTLVIRALILNGIAGVVFGFLYWKHSLESAMVGHMGAHLIMQIPGVIFLKMLM